MCTLTFIITKQNVQAEPDKKPTTAVDTAPVFEVRESRSRAWFS